MFCPSFVFSIAKKEVRNAAWEMQNAAKEVKSPSSEK